MSKVPVKAELYYSGAWHDITATEDVYTRDPITITRGRGDQVSRIPPSTLNMTIENRDGKYSPRNPMSPLYGLIGRNTPIRVSLTGLRNALSLPGVAGAYASTPDNAVLDIVGDIELRADATLTSWTTSSAYQVLIGKWPAPGAGNPGSSYRLSLTNLGQLQLAWSTTGTDLSVVYSDSVLGLISSSGRLAVAVQLDVNNGAAGNDVRFYTALTMAGPWMQLGATQTTAGVTSVFSSSTNVAVGANADGTEPPTGFIHSAQILTGVPSGTAVANPDFSVGSTSFVDAAGRTWTLNGTAAIADVPSYRFTGEVESWPQRWNVKGNDVWAPITANGITRRLNAPGQSSRVQSALLRSHTYASPHGYWPMEAEGLSDTLALSLESGKDGLDPLTLIAPGVTVGVATGPNGSKSLPEWTSTVASATTSTPPTIGRGASVFQGTLPTIGSPPTSWSASVLVRGTRVSGSTTPVDWSPLVLAMSDGSSNRFIDILAGTATTGASLSASSGSLASTYSLMPTFNPFDGNWHEIYVTQYQSGGNVLNAIYVDGVLAGTGSSGAGTCPYPTGKIGGAIPIFNTIDGVGVNNTGCKLALGHLRIDAPAASGPFYNASIGYVGETAGSRIARVCAEAGIAVTFNGDSTNTEPLGPQLPGTTLDVLNISGDVDGGTLYEDRSSLGLVYRTHYSLYNQTSTVNLSYSAGDEVAPPLEPVEDTDATANDITVTRYQGGTARAVQETGTLNVQEPSDDPDGVGRYAKEYTLVLSTDAQALQQATWLRHLGTWDEARFPVINMDLTAMAAAGKTSLISSALTLDVGNRFTINNAPAWVTRDSIVQHAQGFVETIESHHHTIAVNATPALPYDVLRLETDTTSNLSRIPAGEGSTTLNAALSTIDTAPRIISVTVPWIDSATYSAQFPVDIIVTGERMRVTAIVNYLNANPYFETNASSWIAQNGATIARSTAQFHQGAASLLITPDGVSFAPQATSEEVPAVAGRSYTMSGWLRSTAAATRKLGLFWYDASHSFLSSNEISQALSAGVWTQYGPTAFVAPANTAFVRIFTNDPSNPLATNTWHLDEATITSTNIQVFTVARSINGIVKTHVSGTPVQLFRPPVIAR